MAAQTSRLVKTYVRVARPYNSLLPILAVLVGCAAANGLNWFACGMTVVVLFLAHSIVTIWNDIVDAEDDKSNHIDRIGLIKQKGLYRQLVALNAVAALVVYICLLFIGKWELSVLVSTYFFLGWLYNAEPFRLSKKPIGSMLILALAYGLVPFLLGAVLGQITGSVWMLATGWTMNRTSLSLLKDYKDARGDARTNKKTFLLVYGARKTALTSLLLLFCGVLLICTSGWVYTHNETVVVVTGLVGAWLLAERWQLRSQQSYSELNKTFHRCLHYQLLFDGLILGWLII